MLATNFDGRRFTVASYDSVPIDLMFFPHTEEQVLTASERLQLQQQDPETYSEPVYLSDPTIIYCLPNA